MMNFAACRSVQYIYYQNKMSKLRSKLNAKGQLISKSRIRQLLENTSRQKQLTQSKLLETRIFEQTRCHTIESDTSQIKKDGLFHKHIAQFRDSFHDNDTNMLPFLASLRNIKDYRFVKNSKDSTLSPFEAERPTANQKVKKSINDIKANPFRLSKAYYRWHNRTGKNTRESCEFECSLRLDNSRKDSFNPQASSFQNTVAPIRMRTLQAPRYKLSELICQRQKKIFTLESS